MRSFLEAAAKALLPAVLDWHEPEARDDGIEQELAHALNKRSYSPRGCRDSGLI
jgi:hypothetical protein